MFQQSPDTALCHAGNFFLHPGRGGRLGLSHHDSERVSGAYRLCLQSSVSVNLQYPPSHLGRRGHLSPFYRRGN